MADQTERISIEVSAQTAAAVRDVDKLSKAIRAQTEASEESSKSQKTLGKEIKATKAIQTEATEAVNRAKQAQSEHNLVVQAFGPKSKEAAESAQRLAKANEEASKAAKKAADALERVTKETAKAAEAEGDKLSPATKRAANDLERMSKEADRTASEVRKLDLQMERMAKSTASAGKGMGAFFASFAGNLAANAVGALAGKVADAGIFAVETAANFERLKTALTTTMGSAEAANKKFADLQKFAAETPYGLDEVTEAFIKLSNRGINANDRLLTSLGNTASAMGKSLDDAVEAMADAITGENERMKEFGIVGRLAGDQVAYTFRGVTTMVKRDAASISEYLTKIGETNFAGGMEAQSKTLGGLWSTLKDNAAAFMDTFMSSGVSDVLKDIMRDISGGSESAKELAKAFGQNFADGLKVAYGIVKDLAPLLMATAKVSGAVIGTISDWLDDMNEDNAKLKIFGHEIETANDRLREMAKATGDLGGPLGEMIASTLLSEEAQLRLNGAVLEGIRIREDQAKTESMVAAIQARNAREDAARIADLDARKASAEKAAKRAELQALLDDKSLSPSERKRRNELSQELDVAIPTGKGKKRDTGPSFSDAMSAAQTYNKRERAANEASYSFNADVEAEELKQITAAREEAFAAEQAMREARIAGLSQEIELLEAKGIRETEEIDLIFGVVAVEDEAEARRQELHDQRMAREIEFAEWQVRAARTEEDRMQARSRLEEKLHKKRLMDLDKEQKETAKAERQKTHFKELGVNAAVKLMGMSVDAAQMAAKEEKDVGLKMLQSLADALKQKAIVKALEHGAEALGAIASYRYDAAALHIAAAAAWGVLGGTAGAASKALGKKIDKNEAEREKAKETADPDKGGVYLPGRGNSSERPGSPGRGEDTSGVPTSHHDGGGWQSRSQHQQARDPAAGRQQKAVVIQINNPQFLGATSAEVGKSLSRMMRDADRAMGGVR